MQEPNQRDGAAAAGERGVAETAEQVVVRQGPVRRRVRQQGLYRNISVDFERKFREPCFDWIQKIKQDQNACNSPVTALFNKSIIARLKPQKQKLVFGTSYCIK